MMEIVDKCLEKEQFDDLSFLSLEGSEKTISSLDAFFDSTEVWKLVTVSSVEDAISEIEEQEFDCLIIPTEKLSPERIIETVDRVQEKKPDTVIFAYIKNFDKISEGQLFRRFDDFISERYITESPEFAKQRILKAYLDKKDTRSAERILERVTDGFASIDNDDRFIYVNDEACRLLQKSREELIGSKIWDEFPNIIGTPFQKKYDEVSGTREPVYLEEYYEPLDRWLAIKSYPSESGITVYMQDVTERKKREERLERKISQQEATTDTLRMSLEENDLVSIQHAAVEKLTETLGNDFARMWQIDQDDEQLVLAAQHGMRTSNVDERKIELENDYQEAYSFNAKESTVIMDYYQEQEFERTTLMEFLEIRSGITVMVGAYESPWGVLSTFSRETNDFTEDEVRFVEGIANMLGYSINNQEKQKRLIHYKNAFCGAKTGIFMTDSDQKILISNRKFQELCGYSENQLKGREQSFVIENSNSGNSHAQIKRSNGRSRKVKLLRSPVSLPDGTEGEVVQVLKRSS